MKKQDNVHQTACMNANETNKESNDKMLQIAADFAGEMVKISRMSWATINNL